MFAANDTQSLTQILLWAGVLFAACVALAIVVYVFRGRARSDRPEQGPLWNLHDLKTMRDRGDLTEDEYRALKARVIEAFTARSEGSPTTDTAGTDATGR
jgi:hypothetical protein